MILDPEGRLGSLHPAARQALRAFFRARPEQVRVVSGRRSCAEQNALYAGSASGTVATKARGCMSWHVLGRAIDVRVVGPSGDDYACAPYRRLGEAWEQRGGVWGGRFSGFGACGDQFHFEWHPGETIASVCPDPDRCEEVSLAVDREIFVSNLLDAWKAMMVVGLLGFAAFRWGSR